MSFPLTAPALTCSILLNEIEDPVVTIDGHIYDRDNITRWFEAGKRTSPRTNLLLKSMDLVPLHWLASYRKSWQDHDEKYQVLYSEKQKETDRANALIEKLEVELQRRRARHKEDVERLMHKQKVQTAEMLKEKYHIEDELTMLRVKHRELELDRDCIFEGLMESDKQAANVKQQYEEILKENQELENAMVMLAKKIYDVKCAKRELEDQVEIMSKKPRTE